MRHEHVIGRGIHYVTWHTICLRSMTTEYDCVHNQNKNALSIILTVVKNNALPFDCVRAFDTLSQNKGYLKNMKVLSDASRRDYTRFQWTVVIIYKVLCHSDLPIVSNFVTNRYDKISDLLWCYKLVLGFFTAGLLVINCVKVILVNI